MQRLLLNGLAGKHNGLAWLGEVVRQLTYRPYEAPENFPKSFNYQQIKNALGTPASIPDQQHPIAIGTFAPWYVSIAHMQQWLDALPQGQYWQGHLLHRAALADTLSGLNIRHLMIVRDPRVVLASLLLEPEILPQFMRADIVQCSMEQRLDYFCEGGLLKQAQLKILPFQGFFQHILDWKQDKNSFFIKYEDAQSPTKVAELLAYLKQDETLAETCAALPSASSYYDWKSQLEGELVIRIENYCAPLCQQIAYD